MKITVYELLGLIKNGKAPKKIKVTGNIYDFDEDYNFYSTQGTYEENIRTLLGGKHGEINLIANAFNENIEIIEEPILTDKEYEDIEEIKIDYDDGDIALDGVYLTSNHSEILANKINTLIRNQKYILEEINKLNK